MHEMRYGHNEKDFKVVTYGSHIKHAEYLICVDFGRKAFVYGIRHGNLIHTSKIKGQVTISYMLDIRYSIKNHVPMEK